LARGHRRITSFGLVSGHPPPSPRPLPRALRRFVGVERPRPRVPPEWTFGPWLGDRAHATLQEEVRGHARWHGRACRAPLMRRGRRSPCPYSSELGPEVRRHPTSRPAEHRRVGGGRPAAGSPSRSPQSR
jgi:hypothetical protein